MTFLALAVAFTLHAPIQDAKTFTDPMLGLAFSYPKTWTVQKPQGKKPKPGTTLIIPVDGSSSNATLEILRSKFSDSIDLWQTIQLRANETLKREVAKQWQQDVLNVPLLLTKINYTDTKSGSPMSALVGLLYTRSDEKLNFRLTAAAADFDKVQYEFQSALESLRTVNGNLPQTEDPSRPPPETKKGDPPVDNTPKIRKTVESRKSGAKTFRPPVSVALNFSSRKVNLLLPEGWTVDPAKDNEVVIHNPGLPDPITIKLFTTLDSDSAKTALLEASNQSLADFQKVARREDVGPIKNRAGCETRIVWREGTTAKGSVHMLQATGELGQFYCMFSLSLPDGLTFRDQKKVLDALLNEISIEPLP